VFAIDGYMWGILGEVSTKPGARAVAALALKDAQESEWSFAYYLLGAAFGVGMLALVWGAVREAALPTWAGVLFGIGIVMVGTETAIVSNAYFIAGAVVMLAGSVAVAAHVSRMTDEQFAAATG
jgi:hypothetical protein